ncbi:MAG: hypothetical protein A3I75_03745 [Deltaproteobacteria bacterium RIFCSPLOWO2_02_FULL_50_16]|nr:MAG: hypothetical protein A3I75_03745 [Deltaproteobacteria bacterium RIFCSPLOWO2_02_FULL_50_16]
MISVQEAKDILSREMRVGPKDPVPLRQSYDRVLAEDLYAPWDSPPFASSAMDGYALRIEDVHNVSEGRPVFLKVIDVLPAGVQPSKKIGEGETIRIMTGAMIPEGATAVVAQEDVSQAEENKIKIIRKILVQCHIRQQGEELKKGDCALRRGTHLNAGTLGFLASLGFQEIPVFASPRVSVLPTGSELITDPKDWAPGKIFESNSSALEAALKEILIEPKIYSPIPDDADILLSHLKTALTESHCVILTGGVSVGVFDLVKDLLLKLDVQLLFWKVSQKPGKPLYFGRRGNTFVFGLPGNPAASLICFYEYVRPLLLRWLGYQDVFLTEARARLTQPLYKKAGRTHFIRALAVQRGDDLWVDPVGGQDSHLMQSFAEANCLIVVPSETTELHREERVMIHWLPARGMM